MGGGLVQVRRGGMVQVAGVVQVGGVVQVVGVFTRWSGGGRGVIQVEGGNCWGGRQSFCIIHLVKIKILANFAQRGKKIRTII